MTTTTATIGLTYLQAIEHTADALGIELVSLRWHWVLGVGAVVKTVDELERLTDALSVDVSISARRFGDVGAPQVRTAGTVRGGVSIDIVAEDADA